MTEGGTRNHHADAPASETALVTTTWERDTERTPVYAVVTAVADAADDDPLDLPPLAEAIDPDALNALFSSRSGGEPSRVWFQYAGYEVVVEGDGDVRVHTGGQSGPHSP